MTLDIFVPLTNHTNFHLQHVLTKLNHHQAANQGRFSYKTNIGVQHQFVARPSRRRGALISFEIADSAKDSLPNAKNNRLHTLSCLINCVRSHFHEYPFAFFKLLQNRWPVRGFEMSGRRKSERYWMPYDDQQMKGIHSSCLQWKLSNDPKA